MSDGLAGVLLDPKAPVPDGLTDGAGRPAGRRFSVYRNNVAVGLMDALEVAFPAVRVQVGAEFFRGMARLFVRAHPPTSPLMMRYGADLPGFLAAVPPLAAYPWLPDLARLELAMRESYHAADAPPLPPDALALPPAALERARLRLVPAARLLRSPHPVASLWRAALKGGPRPARVAEDVLILRPEFDPVPHVLPPGGGAIVAALMAGAPLGEAAALAPEALAGTLNLLVGHRAILAIDLKDQS